MPASRRALEGGTLTLPDGYVLQVDDASEEFAIALSSHFDIDEIQAFILLRSFLYNEGLSINAGSSLNKSLIEELITAIAPSYYLERVFVFCVTIPLFRAQENSVDHIRDVLSKNLPEILANRRTFTWALITMYLRRKERNLPDVLSGEPHLVSWRRRFS